MSREAYPPVWNVDQFVYLVGEFILNNETCELRGKLRAVGVRQAVEAVVRMEYPIGEGVLDMSLWEKRHKALGHGQVEGQADAWTQYMFKAVAGDYDHAEANYVCGMVAAAVEHRINTEPQLEYLRAKCADHVARTEELTGEKPFDPTDPGKFPVRLITPVEGYPVR